jgi:hypothetical protein
MMATHEGGESGRSSRPEQRRVAPLRGATRETWEALLSVAQLMEIDGDSEIFGNAFRLIAEHRSA